MLLLRKPGVIYLSLLFLCILFASYNSAYGATSLIPGSVGHGENSSLPQSKAANHIVALVEAEDSPFASANPLVSTRFSEKQTANPTSAELLLAYPTPSFPEFLTYNCDPVLNL